MVVSDKKEMIAGMAPLRDPEIWHFCATKDAELIEKARPLAIAGFIEAEGTSLVLPEEVARDLGFDTEMPMARITLSVHSALDGVGLTAAVSTALAEAHIPCNMVAAYHHDHAFVPLEQAGRAMEILLDVAERAG